MTRGPKKHLKRVNAPKHWMLSKMAGNFAPRPSSGPHKLRECLPLILLIRNRLKYALTKREVTMVVMQRHVKIDGKVRTDSHYPTGFMDVVTLDATKENFRMLYDTKGRFYPHSITAEEAKYKLCRVKRFAIGDKAIPYITTHDGRTIRYPDPAVRVHDTVKIDIATGKVVDFSKFEVGNLAMITGGNNVGRVGVITNRERHPGGFDIAHLKDSAGNVFATRLSNVTVIGKGAKPMISLPRGRGVKLSILEERALRVAKKQ
jgi:small subunit ribosomal protein S4e